jgi:3-hydroxyacyl-CoA dehydrogenase / enoyl-CoA hydratase / 3-hydroxybutyryl-CoA epimerase
VAKNLVQEPIPEKLQEKIKLGLLGKKTGKGFFEYDKQGRKQLPFQLSHTKKDPAEDIGKRLLSRLMNEAEICLHEEVVENRDMLEAAMIFGMGFLPKGKLLKSEKK